MFLFLCLLLCFLLYYSSLLIIENVENIKNRGSIFRFVLGLLLLTAFCGLSYWLHNVADTVNDVVALGGVYFLIGPLGIVKGIIKLVTAVSTKTGYVTRKSIIQCFYIGTALLINGIILIIPFLYTYT